MPENIYLCPTTPAEGCAWEGKAPEIIPHFRKDHGDLILSTNAFSIQVANSATQNRLLCLNERVYLVQIRVAAPTGKLHIKMRFLGPKEEAVGFTYTVSISVGSYAFRALPEEDCQVIYLKDGGVEADLQLIKLACGIVDLESVICELHIRSRFPEETTSKANLTSEDSDEDPSPTKHVTIRRRRNLPSLNSFERSSPKLKKHRNSFLQNFFYDDLSNKSPDNSSVYSLYLGDFFDPELDCATCSSTMCPPIFVCANGHSVCATCKPESCGKCDRNVTDIRNADLEDLSMKMRHSCKYAPQGCGERGSYEEIRHHEVNCRFCVYRCCLCPFEGKFSEMKSHFKLLHSSVKIYETLTNNKFPRNVCFAIIAGDHGIFYCSSTQRNGNIEWNVTFCGPKERWFSCDLKIKGKKEELTYSFRHNLNIYTLALSTADLKAAGLKDKYAVLEISA